jgi:outer membrane protein assembly factor BamD (BamD/ComL family)
LRQAGDEALRLANEDYRNGSYSQAIYEYNQYLKRFSTHQGVSFARVNCGLAQLRQATPRGTSDWSAALQVAHNVLEEIASEPEFKGA